MSDDAAVLTERRDRVMVIRLNRPAAMNAIDAALAEGLVEAIAEFDRDPALTVAVLTGVGRVFCAGMDLKAFARGEDVSPVRQVLRDGARKPMIAAIEGHALAGGLELALACDILIAAEDSRLGIPETRVGLFAGGGALLRLPGRVGIGRAMEMALTADPITAEEAARIGLVAQVVPSGRTLEVALDYAARIARNAPLAVAASKRLIRASLGVQEAEYWELQAPVHAEVFYSADAAEGARAFAEKRPPRWSGV